MLRELVKLGRTILTEGIAPKIVKTGPVKENVIKGDDVDLNEFPVPQWNRIDGGRYILTYGGVVTKDPNSGIMNVGVYRGMVAGKNLIPILMWRGAAYRPSRYGVAAEGPQGNADRGRHRLGAVDGFCRRFAGAGRICANTT